MDQEMIEEMVKYAKGLDYNIKQLTNTQNDIVRLREILNHLILSKNEEILLEISRLSDKINLLENQLIKHGVPRIDYYDHEFSQIKKMIESPEWPKAIKNPIIEESDEKGNQILEFVIIESVEGKKVLDFGCGSGYLTESIINQGKAAFAVGFDPNAKLRENDNWVIINKKDFVSNNAPYDTIIAFDTLDHCEDPIEELKYIESVSSINTKIIIRNHPFCSPHGKHLFTTINKSFVHMFFDDIELMRLYGNSGFFTQPVLKPIKEYRSWISQTGLEIVSEVAIESKKPNLEFGIDPYFSDSKNYLIKNKIKDKYKNDKYEDHMKIEFVNYKLKKNKQVII